MNSEYYRKYEPIDGKWYINNELGKGAFGVVLEVERRDFGNTKSAMKIISVPSDADELNNFRQEHYELDENGITSYFYGIVEDVTNEFKIMSQLRGNSNIVSLEDYSIVEHTDDIGWDIFIRMELLTPINKYFSQYPLTTKDVIKLGIDICKALELCSKHNIIHRDIKPANIFISEMGEYKLGDFGIARTLEKTSGDLSKKGTYTYMAPEVYKGEVYNASVDIYSLGIVMYKLLNNNMEPFRTNMTHNDVQNAFVMRMNGAQIPCPANADSALAAIILKACSYNPDERFTTPAEMRVSLENILYYANNNSYEYNYNSVVEYNPSGQNAYISDNDVSQQSEHSDFVNNDNEKNYFWKKPLIWIIVFVLALSSVFFAGFINNRSDKAGYSGSVADKEKPTLTLTPDGEANTEQLSVIEQTLSDRIKILGDNIHLNVEKDRFDVVIDDKNIFGETPEEKIYNMDLLGSKGDFRIIIPGWISDFGKDGFQSVTLESESLDKFKLYMSDKMSDKVKEVLAESKADNIYYFHIKLNPQAAMYYRDCVNKVNEKEAENGYDVTMQAVGNVYNDGAYTDYDELGYVIDINPDGTEFYMISTYFASKKANDLLYTVLNGAELPYKFYKSYKEDATWETDKKLFGKNQVADMDGKQVMAQSSYNVYVGSYDEKSSDEKFAAFVLGVKYRLDKLNTEYMIGYKGLTSRTLVVRISPEAIGADYLRLLMSAKSVSIHSQYRSIAYSINDMKTEIDPEGNIALKVDVTLNKNEMINEYDNGFNYNSDSNLDSDDGTNGENGSNAGGEGKYVYLVVNDVTIARSELAKMEGNSIYFSEFMIFNESKAKNEDINVLDFICSINSDDNYYSCSRENLKVTYSEDGDIWEETSDIPWKYKPKSEIDALVISTIKNMGYEVSKSFDARNSLNVTLDVSKDENFAKNFIGHVKKIYAACDFDTGAYYMIFFKVKGETDVNDGDRARIVVNKDSDNNCMKLVGIFAGPIYETYADDIDDICKNDSFFIQRNFELWNYNNS